MSTTWSSRIRELQGAGWTQASIGVHVGLSPSAVSDIANGRTAEPTGDAAVGLDTLWRAECSGAKPTGSAVEDSLLMIRRKRA